MAVQNSPNPAMTDEHHTNAEVDNIGEDNTTVADNQYQPRSSTPSNQCSLKKMACCVTPPLVCFTLVMGLKAKDTSWGNTIMLATTFAILFGGVVSSLIARFNSNNESSTDNNPSATTPLIPSNV
jgi:hypothetical protein